MTSLRVRLRTGPAVAHYPRGATLGPRVQVAFELVWMLTGEATWRHTPDGGDPTTAPGLVLHPGNLLLSRPGIGEHFAWDTGRPCVHAYLSFTVDGVDGWGPPERWPLLRDHAAVEPLAGLCRYLVRLGGTDSAAARGRVADVVGWALDLFVNGPATDDPDAALPDHVARLVDALVAAWRDGPTRPLGLAELAAAARVSPGHLARIFRERFGVGPVAAVELVRLARAAVLLQRSNLRVGEVAAACGFVNPFHFSRRFHAAYDVSPRAYRAGRAADPLDPVRRAGLLPLAQRALGEDI